MKIFLIGFMGCGKSSLGRKLAAFLKYEFVDLDRLIEKEVNMSIAQYFSDVGEDKFREVEKNILQQTNFRENIVIATGGGAPCYFDNVDWMNRQGKTVYLSMEPKALANRLINSKSERPLIKGLNYDELVNFISLKLGTRETFYSRAQYVVNGLDLSAEKLAAYLDLPTL